MRSLLRYVRLAAVWPALIAGCQTCSTQCGNCCPAPANNCAPAQCVQTQPCCEPAKPACNHVCGSSCGQDPLDGLKRFLGGSNNCCAQTKCQTPNVGRSSSQSCGSNCGGGNWGGNLVSFLGGSNNCCAQPKCTKPASSCNSSCGLSCGGANWGGNLVSFLGGSNNCCTQPKCTKAAPACNACSTPVVQTCATCVAPTKPSCGCQSSFSTAAPPVAAAPATTVTAPAAVPNAAKSGTMPTPMTVNQEQTVTHVAPLAPSLDGPTTSLKPATPDNRSFAAIAAELPMQYHSEDYRVLVGSLDYNPRTNTWRLRYCPMDREDYYGGVVTLRGLTSDANELRSGAIAAVRGGLVDANDRGLSPNFKVGDFQMLVP